MEKLFHRKDMKEAFRAGKRFGIDITMAYDDALPIEEPDFDTWFEEYLKLKKAACNH